MMNLSDINRLFKLSHLLYQSKYADSGIGILWIPLSNIFLIGVLVAIFGSHNREDVWLYVGYISVGYITWSFISDTISNHCDIFRSKRNDLNAPHTQLYEVFVKGLVERVYLLGLNLLVLSFFFVGQLYESPHRLVFLPVALGLLIVQSYYTSIVFSIATLYFPDFKRYLANIIRILFFASPIFWGFRSELAGARYYFYSYNPVTYFLELMRFSLGGEIQLDISFIFTVTIFTVVISMIVAKICLAMLPSYARNIQ